MKTKLVVKSGARRAAINIRLPAIIGRSGESDLKVKHHHVSRKHCEIFEDNGELVIRDLGSSNGTFINGDRITSEVIAAPGDELKLGSVVFTLKFQPAANTHAAETVAAAEVEEEDYDETVPAGASAILRYEENDGGSFVGIEIDEPIPDSVDAAPALDVPSLPSAETSKVKIDIDVDSSTIPLDKQDGDLDKFLEGLGE